MPEGALGGEDRVSGGVTRDDMLQKRDVKAGEGEQEEQSEVVTPSSAGARCNGKSSSSSANGGHRPGYGPLRRKDVKKAGDGVEGDANKNKSSRQSFIYGNYHRYYGYRVCRAFDADPRFHLFKREWFYGKDCLDIGCNEGLITVGVAERFGCASILGVDIDPVLIGKARSYMYRRTTPRKIEDRTDQRTEGRQHVKDAVLDKTAATAASTKGGEPECEVEEETSQQAKDVMVDGTAAAASAAGDARPNGGETIEEEKEKEKEKEEKDEEEEESMVWSGSDQKTNGGEVGEEDSMMRSVTEEPQQSNSNQGGVTSRGGSVRRDNVHCKSPDRDHLAVLTGEQVRKCVRFRMENFLDTRGEENSYDTVLCLSLTKWIHLNWGDEGIIMLFAKILRILRLRGLLILEVQPYDTYRRKSNVSEVAKENYRDIQIFPEMFRDLLIGNIGFRRVEVMDAVLPSSGAGFRRPFLLCYK